MNKRINKVIALLEAGQPVYSTSAKELTYNTGKLMSQTWADLIVVDFEHHAFDIVVRYFSKSHVATCINIHPCL